MQYGQDGVSKDDMDWARQQHKGKITVTRTEHKSPMFSSEDFIGWFDQEWRDSVRMQRARHELTFADKALLIIDAGPDHLAWTKGQQIRLAQTGKETNTILEFLPAGASAHLQPADQIHNFLKFDRRLFEKLKPAKPDINGNSLARLRPETPTG